MNRRLLDPFQSIQLPEVIEEYLDQGIATCLAFNRRGTLLAAGTHEGPVVLYDWDTRGVACTLIGHNGPVTGVSWSRNGRCLASAGQDSQAILWDVLTGTSMGECLLPCAAVGVSLSPSAPYQVVVSLAEGPPLLWGPAAGKEQRLPLLSEEDVQSTGSKAADGLPAAAPPAVACFSKRGDMLIVGLSRAPPLLCVLETSTLKYLDILKMPNSARVTGLILNRKGNLVLANCHDRTLRLYELDPVTFSAPPTEGDAPTNGADTAAGQVTAPTPLSLEAVREQLQKQDFKAAKAGSLLGGSLLQARRDFVNKVDRCKWASACFSADSEHIVAAAQSKTQHHLYVWSTLYGKMELILEGKEGTGAVAWHPLRSCLCSQAWPSGRVHLWARAYAENWSAFAPDFKELDENAEYCEQEDEFDWATPGATGHHDVLVARERQGSAAAGVVGLAREEGDSEPVDIVSVAPDWVFSSDDEDEPGEQLHHLPVVVLPEEEVADAGVGVATGNGEGSEEGREDTPNGATPGKEDDTQPSGQPGSRQAGQDGEDGVAPMAMEWQSAR